MNAKLTLRVSVDDQVLRVLEDGVVIKEYTISTSIKGVGFEEGSERTPTGEFRVAEKFGEGEPKNTIFKGRKPVGVWDGENGDEDLILSRVLWLDGVTEENRNTHERYIYIHGTNHIDRLGQRASCGCIRMSPDDIVELYDWVGVDTTVVIEEMLGCGGKLFFMDCDSTLSTIEGIDELAQLRGADLFARVCALTHEAMNGSLPISEVFPKRMAMISPTREMAEEIGRRYVETMVGGVMEMIAYAKSHGWTPVILSGGFAPLIQPLAEVLGVRFVEAVPLYFHEDGSYAGYGDVYPTTRNHGKNEVIRAWKRALNPERVIMLGDGVSDLETKTDVDGFIGFGGVVARSKVQEGCDLWIEDLMDSRLLQVLSGNEISRKIN